MTDEELKLECLSLALSVPETCPKPGQEHVVVGILDSAEAYYDWVKSYKMKVKL